MTAVPDDEATRCLRLTLGHELGRVPPLCRQAHALLIAAGIDERRAHVCEVVLEEVLSNVLRHGTRNGHAPAAVVEITAHGGTVSVCLTDDGPAFDPTSAPPFDEHLPLEARSGGGMGIHLLRRLTRGVHYDRSGDQNHLHFEL